MKVAENIEVVFVTSHILSKMEKALEKKIWIFLNIDQFYVLLFYFISIFFLMFFVFCRTFLTKKTPLVM